jgi:hypothetical protein
LVPLLKDGVMEIMGRWLLSESFFFERIAAAAALTAAALDES